MYQFSGKIKMFSIILIILGVLGVGFSFYSAPSTVEEAMEMVSSNDHGDGHGDNHGSSHDAVVKEDHSSESHVAETSHESHDSHTEKHDEAKDKHHENTHSTADSHAGDHDAAHGEHVLHQLQNRPWSAVYVALLFFLGISLLVLAFYASQRVAQAGWSIVLFRVMEAITANLVPTSIINE